MITLLWKTWFHKGWCNELDTVRVGGGGGGGGVIYMLIVIL